VEESGKAKKGFLTLLIGEIMLQKLIMALLLQALAWGKMEILI
jgi:hypothetical protein